MSNHLKLPQKTLVALLLALFFVLALGGLHHMGLTYDEADHLRYGVNILHGDADRFDDSKMPVSAWNALPGLIAEHMSEGPVRDALAGTFASRVPTVLAALLLGLLVYRWARELYGDKAGLLALSLFVLDVNILAHARWATTDLYATLGTCAALYFFWRFQRDGGPRAGGLSALTLGFAQIAKYSGVFLVPLFVMLAVVRHWHTLVATSGEGRQGWKRLRPKTTLGYVALFVIVVLLIINAGFLFRKSFTPLGEYAFRANLFRSVQHALPAALPVPVPYPYLEGLDWVLQRERAGSEFGNLYMLGELREGRGFKGYYFVAYLFKVPLPIQILFIAAIICYWRRRPLFHFSRDEVFLLLPVLFFFVYFNFLFEADIGIRFLLVAFPMMHVFTASLLAPQTALGKRQQLTIGALLIAALISVLSYAPHYLSYFNELVPDRKQAYRILADSNLDWGENEYWLKRWMEEHPGAIFEPASPVAGTIVVGVNNYTGVLNKDQFAWLRDGLNARPVSQIAYSYLVFEVTPKDLERLSSTSQ
ncbi:MAG TPA: glycosyltransferase family 39 protein [Rhodocyclaceae bacterium]|nr:glycosyltransferase family 39 protein [Rhodocyclaceae bacterium]